jgi:pyoverdine/dityrosine biosynthesis protein Dit1
MWYRRYTFSKKLYKPRIRIFVTRSGHLFTRIFTVALTHLCNYVAQLKENKMYFYGAVVAANIVYAVAMLYLGEYGVAAFNGGLALAIIGLKYHD